MNIEAFHYLDMVRKVIAMTKEPNIFFITDHYKNYPIVLVKLSKVNPGDLKTLIYDAWRQTASKKLLIEYAYLFSA